MCKHNILDASIICTFCNLVLFPDLYLITLYYIMNSCSGVGRYVLGPDKRFVKYQADAHLESFEQLGVFSGKEVIQLCAISISIILHYATYYSILS